MSAVATRPCSLVQIHHVAGRIYECSHFQRRRLAKLAAGQLGRTSLTATHHDERVFLPVSVQFIYNDNNLTSAPANSGQARESLVARGLGIISHQFELFDDLFSRLGS